MRHLIDLFPVSNCHSLRLGCSLPFSSIVAVVKGAGSRNRKKTCYLCNLHCCPSLPSMFCTDFGGWGESKGKVASKIHRYICSHIIYEYFRCCSAKFMSPSSTYPIHFEKSSDRSLGYIANKNTA